MLKCTLNQVIDWIAQGNTFHALLDDGSLEVKIDAWLPYLGIAPHHGNQLRAELKPSINLTPEQRIYEEDPHTGQLVLSLPICLIAHDSRFEYDLNRPPQTAIYESAWGQQVWKKPLSLARKKTSLNKHAAVYRVLHAIVERIETLHGQCLVFDIHSYNALRLEGEPPLFNLGTEQVDKIRYQATLEHWLKKLSAIELPSLQNSTQENAVFFGRGYVATYCRQHFANTLVLPTEIKKVFCEEQSGEKFPLVFEQLQKQLQSAMVDTALQFCPGKNKKNWRIHQVLPGQISEATRQLDLSLFRLVDKVELLEYVNPINLKGEKRKFFKLHGRENPQFHYRPIKLDPFTIKQQLYSLPVAQVEDLDLRSLYRDTINAYADKIDQLATLGTADFIYASLRYYGEPSDADLANANFLLHALPFDLGHDYSKISPEEVREKMLQAAKDYGFRCKVQLTDRIIAKAMVSDSRLVVLINKSAKIARYEAEALVEHELGVHMVTSMNARLQPLKLLQMGLPINTFTQEGLAILAEYKSGNLTIERLKILALRVIAVHSMVHDNDFTTTFQRLTEDYKMGQDEAFSLVARVYRGGGFTKDYLYLRGLKQVLEYVKAGHSIEPLMIGKTSLAYIDTINTLIDRGIFVKPKYLARAFKNPENNHPVMEYLVNNIR